MVAAASHRMEMEMPALAPLVVSSVLCSAGLGMGVSLHAAGPHGVTLLFETEGPVAARVTARAGKAEVAAQDSAPATRHLLRLEKLAPDTEYAYEVAAGDARAAGRFRTAPEDGKPQAFTFVVAGDARDHLAWAQVARAIQEQHPRFLVVTGDSVRGGLGPDDWRDYYRAAQELFADVPVFSAMGNHDVSADYDPYNPAPAGTSGTPRYYAFAWGNAAFVALDSNHADDPAQLQWMKQALAPPPHGPLFVFQHHPLYSCGAHGSSAKLQAVWQPLFEQAHVTTDFAGHDHDLIAWAPVHGVRYVVSGGAGTVLYPLEGECQGPFAKASYGFMSVTVDGEKVTQTFFDERGQKLYAEPTFSAAAGR